MTNETPDQLDLISDEELAVRGLAKKTAYVRVAGAERSKNAKRVERAKAKKAQEGKKQLNVVLPEAVHDAVKQFAAELEAGAEPATAAQTMTQKVGGTEQQAPATDPDTKLAAQVREALQAGGIKALLLRFALNL